MFIAPQTQQNHTSSRWGPRCCSSLGRCTRYFGVLAKWRVDREQSPWRLTKYEHCILVFHVFHASGSFIFVPIGYGKRTDWARVWSLDWVSMWEPCENQPLLGSNGLKNGQWNMTRLVFATHMPLCMVKRSKCGHMPGCWFSSLFFIIFPFYLRWFKTKLIQP